jgi:hypothetical protein
MMTVNRSAPEEPLKFVRRCLRERKIQWTYHVNMRLAGRYISRDEIIEAADSYEMVEAYPDDKYLPSYLLRGDSAGGTFHVLFAVDVGGDNVRVVTAYRPNADEWEPDFRSRKGQK